MRHIVSECMNININIRVESIAQCDDVLSANAGQLITVHMGQLPSVTANFSKITLYKYTVVQNANTNTQMYRVQIQIQTARCTHVPWQGVTSVPLSIQWAIDVQKRVIWEMVGQYKYNAVCASQGEREIDQCTAVCTQAAPLEWCQQNWCYMYGAGHNHKHMYVRGTGGDRNPPPSRKLPVVPNASPLHLTVLLPHPMLAPLTPYFFAFPYAFHLVF